MKEFLYGLCLLITLIELPQYGYCFTVNSMDCCTYCRSESNRWIKLAGTFQLSNKDPASKLDNPPAYLVDDEQQTTYLTQDGREHKLRYAGAPLSVEHGYSPSKDPSQLINFQYFQIDLAEPKHVGGMMTQGGYHEETLLGFYPYKESWVTQYVVSYSNHTHAGFILYTGESGNVQIFQGNINALGIRVNSFPFGVVARYIRIHPLKAEGESGGVQEANLRVTAVTCARGICLTTRINCLLTDWTSWGDCTCGATGCSHVRKRNIRRVQACGGARCGDLKESEACTPPEPAWKAATQYGGIVLALLVVAAIIGFIIYKKTHKNQVQVIVVTENDEPCVVPRGEKAGEARAARTGFGDMTGRHMDDGFRNLPPGIPAAHSQFPPRPMPRPPMFKFGDMPHMQPSNPFQPSESPPRYDRPFNNY